MCVFQEFSAEIEHLPIQEVGPWPVSKSLSVSCFLPRTVGFLTIASRDCGVRTRKIQISPHSFRFRARLQISNEVLPLAVGSKLEYFENDMEDNLATVA